MLVLAIWSNDGNHHITALCNEWSTIVQKPQGVAIENHGGWLSRLQSLPQDDIQHAKSSWNELLARSEDYLNVLGSRIDRVFFLLTHWSWHQHMGMWFVQLAGQIESLQIWCPTWCKLIIMYTYSSIQCTFLWLLQPWHNLGTRL